MKEFIRKYSFHFGIFSGLVSGTVLLYLWYRNREKNNSNRQERDNIPFGKLKNEKEFESLGNNNSKSLEELLKPISMNEKASYYSTLNLLEYQMEEVYYILDEIIYSLYLVIKPTQKEILSKIDTLSIKEVENFVKMNKNYLFTILEDIITKVLENHKIERIKWNNLIESLRNQSFISKRIGKINSLVKEYLNLSEINLEFDLPKGFTYIKFYILYMKNFVIYFHLFQFKLLQIKNNNEEILLVNKIFKEEIIEEKIVKIRIKLLREIGISVLNSKHLNNCWIFALHNFSKNEKFAKQRKDIQDLSLYLIKELNEGTVFNELKEDPINKSPEEIEKTINQLKKYQNKNNQT